MRQCQTVPAGRRRAWLIAYDTAGREVDSLEVTGPNAGTEGTQSGVEMGARELKAMWHARRSREETALIAVPGATAGPDQVEVRRWMMRLITKETATQSWDQVERRLWTLTTPDQIGGRTGFFAIRFQERNGQTREITVKRTGSPEPDSDTYPGQHGHEAWTFEVTAFDPWWYGQDETDRWEPGGSSSAILQIRNPGDQLGYLLWTFPQADGDATWTVPDGAGVYPPGHDLAGDRIRHELPTVEAGQIAEASQRPDRLPFRILGLPMSFGLMRQARFTHPIEPSLAPVDLPVTVDTTATDAAVEVRLRPAYDRPYS